MESYIAKLFQKGIDNQLAGKMREAEVIYNQILNRFPDDAQVLHRLAYLYEQMNYNGLALNLVARCLQANPDDPALINDMGVLWKKEQFNEQARECYERSIAVGGETVMNTANLAGIYADSCKPQEALYWVNKALAIEPGNENARWQKALALLTMRQWEEGWDHYAARQHLSSWHARDSLGVPLWDFKPTRHLYVHGEQGIGDEIMFLSCLDDALPLAEKVTIEVNAQVRTAVQMTWPNVRIVTKETAGDYSAKIPLGSLACHFRRSTEAFPGTPYIKPAQKRVDHYRRELEKLGTGPYIALTWLGGTKATRVEMRTVGLRMLKTFMDDYTCVSAQYNHTNPEVEIERMEAKLPKLGDAACGADIGEQAALFKAVDAVVTVQQTAVHVAGAVGAKTYVLLSSAPHWRYGLEDNLPWYKSVRLYRHEGNWEPLVNEVKGIVDADLGRVQRAKQAAA